MIFASLFFLLLILRINAQNMCTDKRAVCVSINDCLAFAGLKTTLPLSSETEAVMKKLEETPCSTNESGTNELGQFCCIFENTSPTQQCIIPLMWQKYCGVATVLQKYYYNISIMLCAFAQAFCNIPLYNRNSVDTTTLSSATPKATQPNMSDPDPPDVTNHSSLRLLDHDICGPITQLRFAGKNNTVVNEFPWMALIAYNTGREMSDFGCGGTLINRRYILTAAHCVTNLTGVTLKGFVRLGEHDTSKERDCEKDEKGNEIYCAEYKDFGIESTHPHPQFARMEMLNDIALIRLDRNVDYPGIGDNIRPICLPFGKSSKPIRKLGTLTGWGEAEEGVRSSKLLKANLRIMPNEECSKFYRNKIWYKKICAGGNGVGYTCVGDSGGPLQFIEKYHPNDQFRTIQYGVVSNGPARCGYVHIPTVYTNVAQYMDWILDTIKE